jgi:hypothetical protein
MMVNFPITIRTDIEIVKSFKVPWHKSSQRAEAIPLYHKDLLFGKHCFVLWLCPNWGPIKNI